MHIEKAQLYERVQALAVHDGLTGLYNHQEFQRLLGLEVDRAKRYSKEFSLMMIDADYFKQFNDTYGHPAGDKALKDIGDIIKKNFRSVDIAARYGGEEFVVVLIETPLKQAEDAAERLRSLVASHSFHIEGKTASLTVSIGLASFPADSDTGEGLVKAADQALYNAKNSGRNRACVFTKREENERTT
ncbi:MAG: GGDEF domain-containing protein [Thermodesulfovibrionales bacterium]|nr:GGDEF domain-containing protein [Thermodesulfovibrionales bacterium]